jgi:hypothetical protein
MRFFAALILVLALGYLFWRMQTRRAWIERVPLVFDAAVAVGLAAAGINLLVDEQVPSAIVNGALGTLAMTAALALVHLVAWLVGRMPGCSGIDLDLELPVGDRDGALRWLGHRLAQEGFVMERPRRGAELVAYQGGNPSAWDRRIRPKRLWASLRPAARTDRLIASLRVHYVPPAMGFDGPLRALLDSMLVEDAPLPASPRRARRGYLFPIEFLLIAAFMLIFALVSFYRF